MRNSPAFAPPRPPRARTRRGPSRGRRRRRPRRCERLPVSVRVRGRAPRADAVRREPRRRLDQVVKGDRRAGARRASPTRASDRASQRGAGHQPGRRLDPGPHVPSGTVSRTKSRTSPRCVAHARGRGPNPDFDDDGRRSRSGQAGPGAVVSCPRGSTCSRTCPNTRARVRLAVRDDHDQLPPNTVGRMGRRVPPFLRGSTAATVEPHDR